MVADAEDCTPIPTSQFFGLDARRENADASHSEYRSACAFTKRVTEKRKKAKSCFASVLSPSPPPPPPTNLISSQQILGAARDRRIRGEAGVYTTQSLTETDEYTREVDETVATTNAMIAQLGETNPLLRSILGNAVDQMRDSVSTAEASDAAQPTAQESLLDVAAGDTYGRRLMQRKFEYPESMSEALVDHPIQTALKTGIPGVDIAACEALCEAVSFDTNLTDARNCRAFAHKRADPFSLTDFSGRCFLLKTSGSCKAEDFGAALYTRQIESEQICHNPTPGFADELCIQLPTTRYDTRVLTHADATAIAAQTPRDPAPGSGGLPHPRTQLEAGFLIALARREGIFSFWAASPDNSNGAVVTHWFTEGGSPLVYGANEFRCILIASATSSTSSKMYAYLEPCDAKMADGVVTIAAAAAPPPPPGATTASFFDPQKAPPPPPSIKAHALSIYRRETIFGYTEAVCAGAVAEGHAHRSVCLAFLEQIGKFQFLYGYGTTAPLCMSVCWHGCDGAHVGGSEDDSFANCKDPECATTPCLDFLLRECPPILASKINTKYKETCEIVPPSPPNPPGLPPSPPSPPVSPSPRPPPPVLKYVERFREQELDSDANCELVTYEMCQEVIRQFAATQGPAYSDKMRITTSQCEETDVEVDCFVGCAYGSTSGGTYRFLVDGIDSNEFTRPRCKLSIHPRCACANQAAPPPFLFPPPPPTRFTEEWTITHVPDRITADSSKGHVGVMSQRLVNSRTLDLSLRTGPMHAFQVCSFPPPPFVLLTNPPRLHPPPPMPLA